LEVVKLLRRLNLLDLKLIGMLEEDGRISYREMARRLGVGAGKVSLRVSRLKRLGLLKGFRPVFGGLEYAYMLLPSDSGNLDNLVETLKGNPHILRVYKIASLSDSLRDYRVLVELVALSRIELQEEVERIRGVAGRGLDLFVVDKLIERSTITKVIEENYRRYWSLR